MPDRRTEGRAITAWVSHAQHDKALRIAASYGLSLSALCAMALLDLIEDEDVTSETETRELLMAECKTKH